MTLSPSRKTQGWTCEFKTQDLWTLVQQWCNCQYYCHELSTVL